MNREARAIILLVLDFQIQARGRPHQPYHPFPSFSLQSLATLNKLHSFNTIKRNLELAHNVLGNLEAESWHLSGPACTRKWP